MIQTVALDLIDPGANDRKTFDPVKLAELAASIASQGVLAAPVVRPLLRSSDGALIVPTTNEEIEAWTRMTCLPSSWLRTQPASSMVRDGVDTQSRMPAISCGSDSPRATTAKISVDGYTASGDSESLVVRVALRTSASTRSCGCGKSEQGGTRDSSCEPSCPSFTSSGLPLSESSEPSRLPLPNIASSHHGKTTLSETISPGSAPTLPPPGSAGATILSAPGRSTWAWAGYQIVAGERRIRAMKLLGWSSAPVTIRLLSHEQASAMMLTENMARDDLTPLDEANAYAARVADFGLTNAEVASWAGVSTFRVTMRLRLLDTIPEAQHLLSIGQLPISFAAALAVLDTNRQRFALRAWAESNGTLNQWAWTQMCNRLEGEQNCESMFDADSFLQVDEYVVDARQSQPSTKTLRRLLQEMVRTCEAAGIAADVTTEVRATWPRSWNIAAA